MTKRKSLGWEKYKTLRRLGNYFPVEKIHFKMYLMFSHLQKPCQVVSITYTLGQRAQDVILLFPLLALIIHVTLDRWIPSSISSLSTHLFFCLLRLSKFCYKDCVFIQQPDVTRLESMPLRPGLFRRIALSQGSFPRGYRQRGLVGKIFGSNRARVRGNSGLKVLYGLKVTWREGKF